MSWFDEARFGMFVHWGHVSQRGWELSWPLVGGIPVLPYSDEVAVDDYHSRAMDFSPRPGAARRWTGLAREAGMGYAVLTTKHHDGFAMFDTAWSDFCSVKAACGRDLVAEFVEACRADGLRVGLYFSLSDWHHPDYPAFREEDKPYVSFLGRRSEGWGRFVECLHGQVRELCTNYGPLDVLWFDGQWERSADEWGAQELLATIRELQPGCLVNDRLHGAADFTTPEQGVPGVPPAGRWETCLTMNRTWGWCPRDTEYKSVPELVGTLCETASKGGNLLLNVSPTADGSLPSEQVDRLRAIAEWWGRCGEAVRGTQAGLEPWQFYGPSTRRGDRIFLHLLMRPFGSFSVRGLPIRRVREVRELSSGRRLEFAVRASAAEEIGSTDPVGEVVVEIPEELVVAPGTVVEVTVG